MVYLKVCHFPSWSISMDYRNTWYPSWRSNHSQKRILIRLACNAEMGVVLLRYFNYAEGVYCSVAMLSRRAEIVGLSTVSWALQQSREKKELKSIITSLWFGFENKWTCLCLQMKSIFLKSFISYSHKQLWFPGCKQISSVCRPGSCMWWGSVLSSGLFCGGVTSLNWHPLTTSCPTRCKATWNLPVSGTASFPVGTCCFCEMYVDISCAVWLSSGQIKCQLLRNL